MAAGSMPGTGTNDSSRNRINAPSVNHSLFLSSAAFWKFANVMLEASCSAADAIYKNPRKTNGGVRLQAPAADIVAQRRLLSARLGRVGGEPRLTDLALLGRGELRRILALDQLDRTADLLHRLARALRHAGHFERQLGFDL